MGHVRFVAVHPDHRRRGLGRALLGAAEEWVDSQGGGEVRAGGEAPFYLWPGVDVARTGALCLFEAAGYHDDGAVLNLSCPSSFRADPPEGVVLRRVPDRAASAGVAELVARHWPHWRPELERAVDRGGCVAAVAAEDGRVLGFGCHSVNRAGWVGPIGTDPEAGGTGVGSAVLGSLCGELEAAGHARAEISWVGPIGFYVRAAGASVSRVFQGRVRR